MTQGWPFKYAISLVWGQGWDPKEVSHSQDISYSY